MKSIALFGITGKTGTWVIQKLLQQHYDVKALVRDPARVTVSSPHLKIIQGNALNKIHVVETIKNTEAVINVIGHVKGCPQNLQTEVSRFIIQAMEQEGVNRLINLTGAGVSVKGDNPGWLDFIVTFVLKNLAGQAMHNRITDGITHVELICNTSLEWTIVRAPVLLAKPAKGKTSTGFVGHIPGHSLTYEDLSNEIITILKNHLYIHQLPYITNG